jgi:hypothetical protein
LGPPSKVGGGSIDPDADLKVEATLGFFGAKNAVMCGKGKILPAGCERLAGCCRRVSRAPFGLGSVNQ